MDFKEENNQFIDAHFLSDIILKHYSSQRIFIKID